MDFAILKDIVIIFALSTFVNFLFTKIKVPTIIGYLITGIITGPHLLAIIQAPHEIEIMAEIGVVLLMFTIGLEFSLQHLMKIRKLVFIGGFLQFAFTSLITMVLALGYKMHFSGALFIGFLTALSSTAIVLKLLQEKSEITSNHGRTIVGILIFQDIILIPLLLVTPLLSGESSGMKSELIYLFLKAIGIIIFVYVGNRWIMPKILHWIAMTKNQELFLMSILLICLAVALLTSQLGMSLAFGAFLAGLMISESEYSHNAFGHLIPFKDTFTSFFFVSIGMLLDLQFVINNLLWVVFTVSLVIIVKFLIAGGTAFLLGHKFKDTVIIGLALSQVGEFSFILAKLGVDVNLLSASYYQLFLAVAVVSMSVSPFLIHTSHAIANNLSKLHIPKFLERGLFPFQQIEIPQMSNHIVIIGKDSRSLNMSRMAHFMQIPYLSIIYDPAAVRKRVEKGEKVIYGDAMNEPVLKKAYVDTASIVVVSVGNLIVAMAITEKIRMMNKHAYILVRTKQVEDIEELYRLGANQVIPEEFETAIELFERVMTRLLVPKNEINLAIAKIRDDHYGIFREKDESKDADILSELPNLEVIALKIDEQSPLIGKSLVDLQLRRKSGVTIVAIKRDEKIIDHPDPQIEFKSNDIAYILGKPEQLGSVVELFTGNEGY